MKKTLCMLLISAMLLSLMPMMVFAATPEGTAITSASQLLGMGKTDTGNYYLANDITISGDWTGENFYGNLDGNGHTIYIENGATIKNGVFNGLYGSYVKNLNIIQKGTVTYLARSSGIGVLTRGVNDTDCTISNVYIKADMSNIKYDSMSPNIGAFVGQILTEKRSMSLVMENCVFEGKIVKESNYIDRGTAAMVGGSTILDTKYTASLTIRNCINYGDITSGSPAGSMFGKPTLPDNGENTEGVGIQNITISGCINYGDIKVTGATANNISVEHAGGIFGVVYQQWDSVMNVTNNINYGNVTAPIHGGGIGGGVRYHNYTTYISNGNINYGDVTADKQIGTNVGSLWQRTETYNGTGSSLYNYCDDKSFEKGSASNGTLIDAETMTNLASLEGAADLYTTLPNGKITLSWAKEAGYTDQLPGDTDAILVGAQLSGNATDESRDVRFVCGLGEEFTDLDNVGVLIIAKYGDSERKVFEGSTNELYKSVLAGGEEVYATQYDKDYFYTAVVYDIPTSVGAVTFEVRTFELTNDGSVKYSNPKSVTVDLGELPESYYRNGWTLAAPAYEGGTLATSTYEAGTGIDKDTGAEDLDRAYMMCVSGTTKTEFEAYQNKLVGYGYVLDSENTLTGAKGENNLYCEYRKGDKLIYAYFNSSTKEARIIEDQTSVAESTFEYSFTADASTKTEIYMYGMKYSTTGEATSDAVNNGAFYIIKQADNSLILIDGGAVLQSTAAAKAGLWSFMKEITGTTKVTVACWFVTHPHEDHFKLAYDVLTEHRADIDLQRVMFNFPNPTVTGQDIYEFRGNIDNYFPNVKFLKCHTGQSIHLGSIDIDILMTHEDMVNASTGKSTMEAGNSMTTVARFTLPDGTVFLSLGDLEVEGEEVLLGKSGWFSSTVGILDTSELECDIVTVAHHGYNKVQATYTAAKATYALWSNYTHNNFPSTGSNKWRYERAEDTIKWLKNAGASESNIYYAGLNTVKLTCVNGTITATTTAPVY